MRSRLFRLLSRCVALSRTYEIILMRPDKAIEPDELFAAGQKSS